MSDPDTWVSIRAVAWVIDKAPVPADLAFTLTVIARRCDENGKGSYQSVKTIAEKTGKSEDQAARDIKRLRELGLLLLGDQSLPEKHGVPKGRRPVVYDLPLELKGPKPAKASKNKTGRGKQPTPRMEAASSESSDLLHGSPLTPGMDAGSTPRMEAPLPPCMEAPQTILNTRSGKTSINPHGPEHDTDRLSSTQASGSIDQQPHQTRATPSPPPAVHLSDDIGGRRWLTENLLLPDEEATEVVKVVRHRYPDIAHMARYLERMHRKPDGTLKQELLNIVEAVQTFEQQPTEKEMDPRRLPTSGTLARSHLCSEHPGGPEDLNPIGDSRCLLCNDRRRKAERTASGAPARPGLRAQLELIRRKKSDEQPGNRSVVEVQRIALSGLED